MRDVKIILTDDLTGLEPEDNYLVRDTDSGRVYLGDNTSSPTELTTAAAPKKIVEADEFGYDVTLTDEIIICTGAYEITFDEDLNFPDGKTYTIKQLAAWDLTVKVKSGDAARFEDTEVEIILSPYDSVTIVCFNGNYYII